LINLKNLKDKSPWFDANHLDEVFYKLLNVTETTDTERLSSDFLFTVGNNHAGTYYAVIDVVLPLLIEQIKNSTNNKFIEVASYLLVDLLSFEADPESFESEGERLACENRVISIITEHEKSNKAFQCFLKKIDEELEK